MDERNSILEQAHGEIYQAILETSKKYDLTIIEAILILNKISESQLVALVQYEQQQQNRHNN
jgi:hypothetical protein